MFLVLTFLLLVGTLVTCKPLDDDMLLFWRRSNFKPCSPFTTFTIDCNKCVCSADQVPYCTRMMCATKAEDKLQEKEYSDEVD